MGQLITKQSGSSLPDLLTVTAIALVAYAASNVLHEAVGHGGACIALGGSDELLIRRSSLLTVPAYVAGGLLFCVSGLFNPSVPCSSPSPPLPRLSAEPRGFSGSPSSSVMANTHRNLPRCTVTMS